MNEDKKNLSPDVESEPEENISELGDALEKKLHENEDENVPPEKPAEPTDDDVLAEIKEALDKAENNEDKSDILTGKTADDRFERMTEDDFRVPEKPEEDDKTDKLDEKPNSYNSRTVIVDKKRIADRQFDREDGFIAETPTDRDSRRENRPKQSSPAKVILWIIAIIAVAAAAFALVHFVITPSMSGNNSKDAAQTSAEPATVAPTESVYESKAAEKLSTMSQREKICQLFMVTPEMLMNTDIVTLADNTTAESLTNYPVGGVILTRQNTIGDDQTKALIAGLQNDSKIPLLIARDDDAIISEQTANEQANVDATADGAYNTAAAAAQQKSNLGFNTDFSLNADLSNVRANKSDLTDAQAGDLISSTVKGYNENKVIPGIKYFPGILDAKDSADGSDPFRHIAKTEVEIDASSEFTAFRSGIEAGAGMIMVDHIMVDQVDNEKPATLSDKVVPQFLRKKLNYQGVAVTGDMSAGYFTREYKYSTIVKGIFAADIDLILNPNSIQSYVQEIEGLLESGDIKEDQLNTKVKRILTLKYQSGMMDDSANATEAVGATTASTETAAETTAETTTATVATDSTTAPTE